MQSVIYRTMRFLRAERAMIKPYTPPKQNSFSEEEIEAWKKANNWQNPCDRPKDESCLIDNSIWQNSELIMTLENKIKKHFAKNRYLIPSQIENKKLSQTVRTHCENHVKQCVMVKDRVTIKGAKTPVVAYRMA